MYYSRTITIKKSTVAKQINTQVIRIFNYYLTNFATRNKDSKKL